jgi:hypothetical protein
MSLSAGFCPPRICDPDLHQNPLDTLRDGFFCDARPGHPAAATLAWNLTKTYLLLHLVKSDERSRFR